MQQLRSIHVVSKTSEGGRGGGESIFFYRGGRGGGESIFITSWSTRTARTAGPKIALRLLYLFVCLFACVSAIIAMIALQRYYAIDALGTS